MAWPSDEGNSSMAATTGATDGGESPLPLSRPGPRVHDQGLPVVLQQAQRNDGRREGEDRHGPRFNATPGPAGHGADQDQRDYTANCKMLMIQSS